MITPVNEEIEIIKPDYKGLCDLLDRFIKLYGLTESKVIDDVLLGLFHQPFVVRKNKAWQVI